MGDMADLIEYRCPEEEFFDDAEESYLREENKLLRTKLEFMDAEIRELKKRLGEAEEEW